MITLEIDLSDVLDETHDDDAVVVWPPAHREGSRGQVIAPRKRTIPLVGGKATVQVEPGPLNVQIRAQDGRVDGEVRRLTVPEEGPVTLTGLLDSVGAFTYAPPVLGQVAQMRDAAEDAAMRAEGVADTFGSLEGVADQVQAASDAALSASGSAASTLASASAAATSESAAASSASAAATSEANADESENVALDASAVAIAAAWSFDGFTPAQVSDAALRAEDAADRAENAGGVAFTSAPRNLPAPDITWLDTAQPGHGWVNPTGVGQVEDDTSMSAMGTQSLEITNGVAQLTGLNIDLARQDVVVLYRVESLNPETEVFLQLSDTAGMGRMLVYDLGSGNSPSPWYRFGEWVLATLPNVTNSIGEGTVDESSITTIRARTYGGDGVVHIQAVGVVPSTPGVVSFSFDDGYSSVLDAARRVLSPRGIRGTSYTIPDLVGGAGFMSLADNRELHDIHGWDIQAHTQIYYSFGGDNAPLEQEMKDARSWIAINGFGAGEHLAWAGGQSGPDIEQVARTLFRSSRTITDMQMETVPPARPHRLRAHSSIGGSGGTSVGTVKGLVDRAKLHGGWLHLGFHRIVEGASTRPEDCPIADLEAIADYVVESGLPVQTVSEVLAGEGTPPIRRRFLTQQEYDAIPAPRDRFTEFVIVGDPLVG